MRFLYFLLIPIFSFPVFTQNVGINSLNPSSTLHVIPSAALDNPLQVEGIKMFTVENDFYVLDRITGIVKYMPLDSLLTRIPNSTSSLNLDSVYKFVSDSLLKDSLWLDSLVSLIKDSVDTDVSTLIHANDTLYLTENGVQIKTRLPLTQNTDTDIDSLYYVGDTLYIRESGVTLKTEIPQSSPSSGSVGGYDTTEYLTGQNWIDGSPIYGRVLNNYTGPTPALDFSSYYSPNEIEILLDMRILMDCSGTPNNSTHVSGYGSYSYNVGTNMIGNIANSYFAGCSGGTPRTIILEYTKQ